MAVEPQAPANENHALLIGQVWGILSTVFPCRIIDVDGVHSDTVEIKRPSGVYRVTVAAL